MGFSQSKCDEKQVDEKAGLEINFDEEGTAVLKYRHPGAGTKLAINGNLYRIVYTKNKGKNFSAEYVGRHEPKNNNSETDNQSN